MPLLVHEMIAPAEQAQLLVAGLSVAAIEADRRAPVGASSESGTATGRTRPGSRAAVPREADRGAKPPASCELAPSRPLPDP